MPLPGNLAQSRTKRGLSQDDLANALGVSRAMVSYWESGKRRPNDRQLAALSRLLRVSIGVLLGHEDDAPTPDVAAMMLRGADQRFPERATSGLNDFIKFLDNYSNLAKATDFQVRGMHQSPFVNGAGFTSADDARRKSEEVRSYLGLGLGPIGDIEAASELMGITVYQACLGSDLSETISGAFLNHAEIGFSIVINLEMTPGRRRFTVAHELAHALFHSDDYQYAVSTAAKPPRERFADAFAGEFLMPTEGLRRVMEDQEFGVKIEDPSAVIYLQRFFGVSYVTALVRLRQANFLSQRLFNDFKRVRPVILAESLGYDVASEEYTQPPEIWRRNRYPQRFLRLIRSAVIKEIVSISTISSLTQLTVDEITEIVTDGINLATHNEEELAEMKEFEVTGVLGGN